MSGDQYASGNWHVQAGSEDEFIARWQAFITESAQTTPGFGSARLLRDADDPRHFLSFSDWADATSREAWKASPEFERVSRRAASSATSSRARTPRRSRASDPEGIRRHSHRHALVR